MHHKLFDRGAFTVSDDLSLRVSQKANGTTGLSEWLMDVPRPYAEEIAIGKVASIH